MIFKKSKILFSFWVTLLFWLPRLAGAQTSSSTTNPLLGIPFKPSIGLPIENSPFSGATTTIGPDSIGQYINTVYRYGGMLAGIAAMFMLVYAGWEWLFAAGNSGKISKAQDTIRMTLIGLAFLFGGYLLLSLISTNLVKFKSLEIQPPSFKTGLCASITKESDCYKQGCAWIAEAALPAGQQGPPTPAHCVDAMTQECPASAVVQDVNIPGLQESGCSDCRLTIETINKLKVAVGLANNIGGTMTIKSAFRSMAKQGELYWCYENRINDDLCSSNCATCQKAAKPSCESPHQTGKAVDVCLKTSTFDSCGRDYQDKGYLQKKYNCGNAADCPAGLYDVEQKLKSIMEQAGFSPISEEWWHFNS